MVEVVGPEVVDVGVSKVVGVVGPNVVVVGVVVAVLKSMYQMSS